MNDLSPALPHSFSHVTDWVFDLDNTLYPRTCKLFSQIDVLITRYVMKVTSLDVTAAHTLQKAYYRDFGTTLNGLMQRHQVDPDDFLKSVHSIDYSPVAAHPELVATIRALPGRKFILTNGDVGHARAVLGRLGGDDLFEVIHDIRAMGYQPKPLRVAYDGFFAAHGIEPTRAVMFDDLDKNLLVPHEVGMTTVHVVADGDYAGAEIDAWELAPATGPHVHYVTDDLLGFLQRLP